MENIKKRKAKAVQLQVELYSAYYTLLIADDKMDVQNWLQKRVSEPFEFVVPSQKGGVFWITYPDTGNVLLAIWVEDPLNNLGTLSHEIFHLTSYILRDKRILLDENSEEAYAYLNGYLFNQVHKEYVKYFK